MKNIKTEWNFKLLFESLDDPKIEEEIENMEKVINSFREKYNHKDGFLKDENLLLEALQDYENIRDLPAKACVYLMLLLQINSNDSKVSALYTKLEERIAKIVNLYIFFDISIKIKKQKEFLQSKKLLPYRYFLKRIFDGNKYNFSLPEEEIISLLTAPAYTMWVDLTKALLNRLSVTYKGEKIPFSTAFGILAGLPRKDRKKLYDDMNEQLKTIAPIAGAEMNAIVNFHKITDEKRKFKKPYSETVLEYQNDEETVENLVELITSLFGISHRFYSLQARLLNEKKIGIYDIYSPIGEVTTEYSFDKTVDIVHESLSSIDPEYGKIFKSWLENGQIDAFPREGKCNGAFCFSDNNIPIYILLNHVNNASSAVDCGHEAGHGIHCELSKSQPVLYRSPSVAVAETASTFFEQVTFEKILESLPAEEKVFALHQKIQGDISTIFRPIAFFNFELELHKRVRAEGKLSFSEMALIMQKHLSSYLGPDVEVTPDDGLCFVRTSHIRTYFYVYAYAYGLLISKVLLSKWKKDKSFAKKIKQFLSAGGSDTPYNIFKSIGIDTKDPEFFKSGLMEIDADISRLEALAFPKG